MELQLSDASSGYESPPGSPAAQTDPSGPDSDAPSEDATPPGSPATQTDPYVLPFSPPPGQQRSTLVRCPITDEGCPITPTQGQKLIAHLNDEHVPLWTVDFVRRVYVNKTLSYPTCIQLSVVCCACGLFYRDEQYSRNQHRRNCSRLAELDSFARVLENAPALPPNFEMKQLEQPIQRTGDVVQLGSLRLNVVDHGGTVGMPRDPSSQRDRNVCFYLSASADPRQALPLKRRLTPTANALARARGRGVDFGHNGAVAEEEVCIAFAQLVSPLVVVTRAGGRFIAVQYSSSERQGPTRYVLFQPGHYCRLASDDDLTEGKWVDGQGDGASTGSRGRGQDGDTAPGDRGDGKDSRKTRGRRTRTGGRAGKGARGSDRGDRTHWLELYFDGGHRRGSDLAGAGFVLDYVTDSSRQRIVDSAVFLPDCSTNNVAEYTGLLKGLDYVTSMRTEHSLPRFVLKVFGDSELVIKQIRGEYSCEAAHLRPLHDEALGLIEALSQGCLVTLTHLVRERNAGADAQANRAMDDASSSNTLNSAAQGHP